MNYSSQASAERWEKAGIGEDSGDVWTEPFDVPTGYTDSVCDGSFPVERGLAKHLGVKIIGPAMVSDEMGDYLWSKGITTKREDRANKSLFVAWYEFGLPPDMSYNFKTHFKAKTLTDAYEQAINWYLDQKEE